MMPSISLTPSPVKRLQLGTMMYSGAAITGPEPKRARLLDTARQARWLHFSGHAVYNPRDPLDSELRTGLGETLSARAIVGLISRRSTIRSSMPCSSRNSLR